MILLCHETIKDLSLKTNCVKLAGKLALAGIWEPRLLRDIHFAPEIASLLPDLRLGVLEAQVQVTQSQTEFWQMAEPALNHAASMSAQAIREIPALFQARQAYKKLGQDPSRYRLSAEALLRRLSKSKDLYQISNLVDLINYLSFSTGISIGGYDASKISGDLILRIGQAEDQYQAIGRGPLNIAHLPVLSDHVGPFGNPTSDSQRTSIQAQTQTVLLVFFDFGASSICLETMHLAQALLKKYAEGQYIQDDLFTAS